MIQIYLANFKNNNAFSQLVLCNSATNFPQVQCNSATKQIQCNSATNFPQVQCNFYSATSQL